MKRTKKKKEMQKQERRGICKEKGITLVALVITIIVLLILAGVTMSMVVGDNGIITKAQQAKQNMANATAEEEQLIQNLVNSMNTILEGEIGGIVTPPDEPESNIKEYHNGVPIPKGFYYVGGEAETGLVISDNPADENAAVQAGQMGDITVELEGNQFVWIPVEVAETDTSTSIAKFQRTTTYDGTITAPSSSYTEPYSGITKEDETGEKAEYEAMYASVYEYHGFYVGRYETGCETERIPINQATAQGPSNPILVQKNKFIYNYVTWGASMTSTAPVDGVIGAVELSRGMYPKENEEHGVVSHLMYGVQWDAVMEFVNDAEHPVTGDSTSWGNYSNYKGTYETVLQKTGSNENWKAKNVYDLAGNGYEWTMEAFDTANRVARGGGYCFSGSDGPAASRHSSYYPGYTSNENSTFRLALYVKVDA